MNPQHWLTAPVRALWRWLASRHAPTLAPYPRPLPDRVHGEREKPWERNSTALRDATNTRPQMPDNVREFPR